MTHQPSASSGVDRPRWPAAHSRESRPRSSQLLRCGQPDRRQRPPCTSAWLFTPIVTNISAKGAEVRVAWGRLWPNGVKLGLQRCKIIRVARPGQQVVAGDRLADRIGIGVLAAVFTPGLVDRGGRPAGGRGQPKRTLPAPGAGDSLLD